MDAGWEIAIRLEWRYHQHNDIIVLWFRQASRCFAGSGETLSRIARRSPVLTP